MTATASLMAPPGSDPGVSVVGVAWQSAPALMAPFAAPTALAPTALLAAALQDAAASWPTDPLQVFSIGDSGTAADLRTSLGVCGRVECYGTLADAVIAAIAALQVTPATACVVGAMGQAGGAWLVLENTERAHARGAAAYAALVTVGLTVLDRSASSIESTFSIGWLELPGGEPDVAAAEQVFAPTAALLASALRSASLASAEEKGVRDALSLVRATLALGHKILPLCRLPDSGQVAGAAAPLPWIAPLALPGWPAAATLRQAGWLAATEPGQPAYLLLQEDPAAPARPDPIPFSHELLVFGADSPAALHQQVVALRRRLGRNQPGGGAPDLASLAYQTVARLPSQPAYRLAVVSSSVSELDQQLGELVAQLAQPSPIAPQNVHRPSRGIYYGSEARGSQAGSTAFLFPGLGASYPYMLGDLGLHFPAVRAVFDNIDYVAAALGEPTVPSQQVFPWPGQPTTESITGAAVITLLMAEWALAQLLRELGITPDALMGCSTGEFAALCQGGSIDAVAALPIFYRLSLGVARGLPEEQLATLQSVLVATAVESLTPLLDAAPGPLYVSADLGPDCALLVGERESISWLLATLDARGVAAHVLPSSVPYHTPLLNASTVSGAKELSALTVLKPELPIWSCATGLPYPAAPAVILEDASVLFVRAIALRDTVLAMYESGVRTFLEVGPGEGLGRRVAAILRGRPHVTLASNVQQRSGVNQLLQLLAALHALGYALDLAPLFRRRHVVELPEPSAHSPQVRTLPVAWLPRQQRPDVLLRSGTALPALTLGLPHCERWFGLRLDRRELVRAMDSDGKLDLTAIYSAAELQQRPRGRPAELEWESLLCDLAAKRAAQELLRRLQRLEIALPAIELRHGPVGPAYAAGDFTSRLGGELTLATASCGDAAVALVAAPELAARVGIQIGKIPARPLTDARTAVWRAHFPDQQLTPSELQVVAADPFTGWVALRAPRNPSLFHARGFPVGAYLTTVAVLPTIPARQTYQFPR